MVGSISFIAGVIIALLSGFMTLNGTLVAVLMVLGLIVGVLNVTQHESTSFLFSSLALVIVAALSGASFRSIAVIGPVLDGMFGALLAFVVPATIVVALKTILNEAKD